MNAPATELPSSGPNSQELKLVLPGRHTPAGSGWTWIAQGWSLFMRSPVMWIIAVVIIVVAAIVLGLVPVVGTLALNLLSAVISAGLVVACRSLERGGEFELDHLLAGFRRNFGNLLLVGVFFMVASLLLLLVFAFFVGFSVLGAVLTGDPENVSTAVLASLGSLVIGGLVTLALMIPLIAAYWFAPALVMMHDLAPLDAMKASFFGAFGNFIPFIVYGLVMSVLLVVAMLPFGLGLLVWVPVAFTSTYVAYRQIFTEDTAAPMPTIKD